MHRYHCPRCNVRFHSDEKNVNQRHRCGEFARLEWEYERKQENAEG